MQFVQAMHALPALNALHPSPYFKRTLIHTFNPSTHRGLHRVVGALRCMLRMDAWALRGAAQASIRRLRLPALPKGHGKPTGMPLRSLLRIYVRANLCAPETAEHSSQNSRQLISEPLARGSRRPGVGRAGFCTPTDAQTPESPFFRFGSTSENIRNHMLLLVVRFHFRSRSLAEPLSLSAQRPS